MRNNVSLTFFLVLLFIVTLAFFGLITDYLLPCFWAILLAILFHPTFQKFKNRFKQNENMAAAATLIIIILLVVIPVFLVGTLIINESIKFYRSIESGEVDIQGQVEVWEQRMPLVQDWLESFGIEFENTKNSFWESIMGLSKNLAQTAVGFTQNIFGFLLHFFVMLYILFFFLKDGTHLVKNLVRVLPLGDKQEWELIRRFASVARATVKGSLVVAIVQGTMGGILFWAVGIQGAVIWAVIMTIVSLLPVGSGLVWVPVGVVLIFQGDFVRGLIVLLIGAFVIGLVDNLLRPRLVGRDTKMPDYLILISTLGGLTWFGISGFVIGPVIAAFFITCWQMLSEVYIVERQKKWRS